MSSLGTSLDEHSQPAIRSEHGADASMLARSRDLEPQFRRTYLEQNVGRATVSTAIFLALIAIVTALDVAHGRIGGDVFHWVLLLRLGVACPALVLILCVLELRALHSHYQSIVGSAAIVLSIAVMGVNALQERYGLAQFQVSDVLVIVYACLFLGLRYRVAAAVATAQVLLFVAAGALTGAPLADLTLGCVVIVAAVLMVVLAARRVEQLSRTSFYENRALTELAERDGLTGLYNRRKLDELAARLWAQARRDSQRVQVLLIDIDCFKSYNEMNGHQAADEAIRRVARIVDRSAKRPLDFAARYGGDEFVLVLYGPSSREPAVVAERIRAGVIAEAIPHEGSNVADLLTVSIGSAAVRPNLSRSFAGLVQHADECLFMAKQAGRNLVVHEGVDSHSETGRFRIPTAV